MSETQRDGSEMRCKRCGANECRIHGFCSVECEHYFDYEEEITDLEARIAELEEENRLYAKDNSAMQTAIDKFYKRAVDAEARIAELEDWAYNIFETNNGKDSPNDTQTDSVVYGKDSD